MIINIFYSIFLGCSLKEKSSHKRYTETQPSAPSILLCHGRHRVISAHTGDMILYLSSEATAGYALSTLADMQVSGLVRPVT